MLNYSNIHNTRDLIKEVCNGQGEVLEIHNLRPTSPTLLNRDGNGDAKTAIIGGTVRTLISSQCRKSSIRNEALNSRSERTRRAPERIACYIKETHPEVTEEYLESAMKLVCEILGEHTEDKKKKENRHYITSVVITVGKEDVKRIGDTIVEKYGLEAIPKDAKKELSKELGSLVECCKLDYDICLFGRMSTNEIVDTVSSASYFSFGFSVNENAGDNDTFTAQDTFDSQCSLFGNFGTGAGHLDDRTISSDTFYEYCGFSIPAYLENVMKGVDFEDKELVKERLKHAIDYLLEVVKLCVIQAPTAMQHQMCSMNSPVSFVALTRGSQLTSYGNAYEHAINPRDYEDESILDVAVDKLVDVANDDTFFYGEYLKKYWLSKQYKDKANIEDVNVCKLVEMLEDLRGYFYGQIGI